MTPQRKKSGERISASSARLSSPKSVESRAESEKRAGFSSRSRRRGLTLAEVLATITIMAIVMPVLMQGISLASGLASVTRQRAQALSLAQSKLDEIILTGDWQTASMNGDFSPDYPEFTWEANVGDWEEVNMRQIQLVVHWAARGAARDVTLSTLIYDTAEATQ